MALKKKLIWDFRRNLKAKIVPIELYFLKVVFKILSGRRWVIWWGGMGGISHKICIMKKFTDISQPFLWWSCSCLFYEGCTEVDWQIRAYHELIIC